MRGISDIIFARINQSFPVSARTRVVSSFGARRHRTRERAERDARIDNPRESYPHVAKVHFSLLLNAAQRKYASAHVYRWERRRVWESVRKYAHMRTHTRVSTAAARSDRSMNVLCVPTRGNRYICTYSCVHARIMYNARIGKMGRHSVVPHMNRDRERAGGVASRKLELHDTTSLGRTDFGDFCKLRILCIVFGISK